MDQTTGSPDRERRGPVWIQAKERTEGEPEGERNEMSANSNHLLSELQHSNVKKGITHPDILRQTWSLLRR